MIYEKIVITDDPATWPSDEELCYYGKYGWPFNKLHLASMAPQYSGAWWWLKPIDLDAVKAEVWHQGYREGCCDGFKNKTPNPYRKEETK